jgi:hypothetical protein
MEHWIDVERCMRASIDVLESHVAYKQFKVLGLNARYTVALSIGSAAFTFYASLLSAFYAAPASGSVLYR